jgi:uncharacterized protein
MAQSNTSKKKFFVVHYVHRDLELWHKHLEPHVQYLKDAVAQGLLRASGPLRGLDPPARHGMLIFACPDRDTLIASLVKDPFHIHGVVDEMTITDWDPVFGSFSEESSGQI